jgi:VWFA-related protein
MSRIRRAAVVLLALAIPVGPAAQQSTEPVETDLTEEVEVRFVIIDALVLDSSGDVVTELKPEDFELYIDLNPHPVESVDLDCPNGAFEDPRPVEHGRVRETTVAPVTSERPRRIIHVVDYKNLPQTRRVEVVRDIEAMIRNYHTPNEELMIVAVTSRLRVEQPFTRDRDEILHTLRRMVEDPSLWQEHVNPHYAEFALFDALTALIRMLSGYEGSKAIVLFSDLPSKVEDLPFRRMLLSTPAAFDYDRQFDALATSATDARVALYPIHSRGLSVRPSSKRLARLAVETGGRFTQYTNDLSLSYVRAQRDLACRYAIGFYDSRPTEDRLHRINLKVRNRGVRVIHPSLYRFGSRSVASKSLAESAYSAPSAFRSERVRGHVYPIRPVPTRQWEAAVALRFPVTIPADEPSVVEFGAKLDDHARRAVHTFDSSVTIQGHGETGEQPFVVIEPVDLKPGVYELSIVVNDPGADEPRTAVTRVELPPIPRRGPVLVGPLLIRHAGEGVEVQWSGRLAPLFAELDETEFEPLLSEISASNTRLLALTRLCWPRPRADDGAVRVERTILEAGRELFSLSPVELEPATADDGLCRPVLDNLPTEVLGSGRFELLVQVHLPGEKEPILGRVPFNLGPAARPEGAGRGSDRELLP